MMLLIGWVFVGLDEPKLTTGAAGAGLDGGCAHSGRGLSAADQSSIVPALESVLQQCGNRHRQSPTTLFCGDRSNPRG